MIKNIFLVITLLLTLSILAGEMIPPSSKIIINRLSADGWYESSYRISAAQAFENENESITLKMPYYTVGGSRKVLKASVSARKICRILNLGKKIYIRTERKMIDAGNPWALMAEGRELTCTNCKDRYITEITCEGK